MSLDDLVTVNVTRADVQLTRAGFGTPMVIGYHTKYLDRVRSYERPDDMIADGFTVNDMLYKAVAKAKSQKPSPRVVKVGRMALPITQTVRLTPINVAVGYEYTFDVVEYPAGTRTTVSYVNDATPTVAEATAGLTADIDALATLTGVDGTTHMDAAAAAGVYFDLEYLPPRADMSVELRSTDPGIATDLAAIAAADNDWITFEVVGASKAIALAAAAWAESQKLKVYGFVTSDSICADSGSSTDVFSSLDALDYVQTYGLYCGNRLLSFGALAWAARLLPEDPGSATWALKTITGQVADALSTTELDTIHDKHGNAYITSAGVAHTSTDSSGRGGWTPGAEYIDLTLGIMYIRQRQQEDLAVVLLSNKKIPYTKAGMLLLETPVRARLAEAVDLGILSGDTPFVVTVPDPSIPLAEGGVDPADKAARIVDSIRWSAVAAGAVHHVIVNGTVSLT